MATRAHKLPRRSGLDGYGRGFAGRAAFSSSTMRTLALAPMRVAPPSSMCGHR